MVMLLMKMMVVVLVGSFYDVFWGLPFGSWATLGLLNGVGDGGSLGGGVPPLSSLLTDIVEKVKSTLTCGYWVCLCWGNSKNQDSNTSQ